jgi:hypothetical protein
VVDGVYRLDEGAVLDDFFHFLPSLGVMAVLEQASGAGIHRAMVPFVQYVWLYGLKTLLGIERINARPNLLFSAEALRPLVGFKAQQVRHGVCQRGASTWQGERAPGPICPDTLAKNIVKWNVRALELVCNGAIRAVAKAGVVGKQGAGMADGTDLETTARDRGCGHVTRTGRREDTRGPGQEIEVTVYGWKGLLWLATIPKMPLAVKGGQMQEHEARWARALVTQARMNLAGDARLANVVFDQGFGDGPTPWWRDQQGIHFVVSATTNMAVTADARAQAAAGEARTVGRRVHTVRHGQGNAAWSERRATEVVGITGLTSDDQ